MNVYLVRHGETDQNAGARGGRSVLRGWDNAKLNTNGKKQMMGIGKTLAGHGIQIIFSSDVPRAQQAAKIVSRCTGADIVWEPRLRTFDMGDWTGWPDEGWLKQEVNALMKAGNRKPPGGSETFQQFLRRVEAAFNSILAQDLDNVALQTHSTTMRTLLNALEGKPLVDDIEQGHNDPVPPGGAVLLRFDSKKG